LSPAAARPEIIVLAGTNGAGKSSIAGETLRLAGGDYFNPDEVASRYGALAAGASAGQANAWAWNQGRVLLEQAIERRLRFALETTLGGNTIPGLLLKAANVGLPVRMWYVGLSSPELHLERVRARVGHGGHDIPEPRIRQRYDTSRQNLIRLLPHLAELKLYDNSLEFDPKRGEKPRPTLILHFQRGQLLATSPLHQVPEWAKPIVHATSRSFGPPQTS
jgi:predicted ABC-type ATPase